MNVKSKNNAKICFSIKVSESIIKSLSGLKSKESLSYCKRASKLTVSEFLEELSNNDEMFSCVLQSQGIVDLLHEYFSKSNNNLDSFEKKVAQEFPQIYIKAIRVNQVFLKNDRIDFLETLDLSVALNLHIKVWRFLHDKESKLYSLICNEFNEPELKDVHTVLSEVLIWLEKQRFNNSSSEDLHHLADVYNFFIKKYFALIDSKSIKIDKIGFTKLFIEGVKSNKKDGIVFRILEHISAWEMLNDNFISAYSYDLEINPKEENGIIYFNKSPLKYYQRKLDGVRYGINSTVYQEQVMNMHETLLHSDASKVPIGNSPEENEMYYSHYIQGRKLDLFLSDLCIDTLNYKNSKQKVYDLFYPLLSYSQKCYYRYELPFKKKYSRL